MRTTKETNTKNKIPKANNGITLIALVITIIVMLILVAVTITMAVNGGLFGYAGKATGETQNAINAEQELANLQANMTVDELINKYTDEKTEGDGEKEEGDQPGGENDDGTVTFYMYYYKSGTDGETEVYTAEKGQMWTSWLEQNIPETTERGSMWEALWFVYYEVDSNGKPTFAYSNFETDVEYTLRDTGGGLVGASAVIEDGATYRVASGAYYDDL